MTTTAIRARLAEIRAILDRRDCRNGTPEDVAIIREWAGLLKELRGRLWPEGAKEETP